jgi:hypothetical protein
MPFLHGRHAGPLLAVWVAGLLFAALLVWVHVSQPALDDILPPLYVLVGLILGWSTVRWFFARRRVRERRRTDRRHANRHVSE